MYTDNTPNFIIKVPESGQVFKMMGITYCLNKSLRIDQFVHLIIYLHLFEG